MEVNRDAFFVFADEVWPRLSANARESARIVFAGGFPSDEIRQRARDIGVELQAPLSETHASELFRKADLFFSPVRTGTGIKIKTLDAMAHGKPMVGFKGAFRGVPIESGKHALVAETPADFARLLESLLADAGLRQRIGAAGREFVRTHFDPDLLGAELVEVYQRVAEACAHQQASQVNGPIRLRPDFQD
jgi:glycosyltransferase involved in cell wall biosynthesis